MKLVKIKLLANNQKSNKLNGLKTKVSIYKYKHKVYFDKREMFNFIKEFDEHPFYEQIKICESFKLDLQALKDYDKNCKTENKIVKQNIANLDTFINLLSSRIEVEPSNDEIEMYNL